MRSDLRRGNVQIIVFEAGIAEPVAEGEERTDRLVDIVDKVIRLPARRLRR
jgi:hypothetical protein